MMPARYTLFLTMTMATAVAGLGGCAAPQQSHDESKNAAHARWDGARSNISYSLAEQQFEVGDLDKAEKTVSEAIATQPEQPQFYDLAARISMERGRLERAYRQLEHSLELDDDRYEPHYLTGVLQQRWQRYEQALESYEAAFERHPEEPTALLAAAEMLVKLNRTDEAVERLEDRLSYFANSAAIRTTLGRIHMMQHEYGEAVSYFREASVLSPNDETIQEHLALAAFADGQYGQAIRVLSRLTATEANSDRDDLKVVLGDAYMATENPVRARRIFIELTEEDPNDVNAWVKLAQAAWMVGDQPRLEQATARVLALAPRRHEGHLLKGMAMHREGESEDAVAHFERASELAPDSAMPHILKGMAEEGAGDTDGAAASYRRALELAPDDRRARELLAGVTD